MKLHHLSIVIVNFESRENKNFKITRGYNLLQSKLINLKTRTLRHHYKQTKNVLIFEHLNGIIFIKQLNIAIKFSKL